MILNKPCKICAPLARGFRSDRWQRPRQACGDSGLRAGPPGLNRPGGLKTSFHAEPSRSTSSARLQTKPPTAFPRETFFVQPTRRGSPPTRSLAAAGVRPTRRRVARPRRRGWLLETGASRTARRQKARRGGKRLPLARPSDPNPRGRPPLPSGEPLPTVRAGRERKRKASLIGWPSHCREGRVGPPPRRVSNTRRQTSPLRSSSRRCAPARRT